MAYIVILPQKRAIKGSDIETFLTKNEALLYPSVPKTSKACLSFLSILAAKKVIKMYFDSVHKLSLSWKDIEVFPNDRGLLVYTLMNSKKKYQRIASRTHLSFSLAGNVVMVGISDQLSDGFIGVNVEKIRNFRSGFLSAFLTPRELKQLRRYKKPESKNRYATALWSIKEACLKSFGGIFLHPHSLEVIRGKNSTYKIYKNKKLVNAEAFWWNPYSNMVASQVFSK